MNNGVNNTNQTNTNVEDAPTLAPMAGVKIAPAEDGPVNASTGNNTAVVNAAPQQTEEPVMIQENVEESAQTAQPAPVTVENPQIVQNTSQQVVAPTPVSTEPQPAVPVTPQAQQPQVPQPTPTPVVESAQPEKIKKKVNITPILVILVIGLIGFLIYSNKLHTEQIANLKYNCTPITSSKEEIKLDLNSTLVKDLYSKVETSIREDIANPNFDDSMKLYLAYRQIKEKDKYDSNCNLFSTTSMEPYICEVSTNFVPKAFKAETLQEEIKKLYGEETQIPLSNIQLGSSCVVGYQYIKDRGDNGEFVEGYCKQSNATSFKVTKTLKEATSTRNTIILKEEVKYHENERMNLPETLKSGYYYYTFRLDMNYNYVLVNKTYESKY